MDAERELKFIGGVVMTQNQKRFAEVYVKCGNATQAYKKVYEGSNDNTASTNGSKLLNNSEIRDYIDKLNKRIDKKNIASLEDCLKILTDIMNDDETGKTDKLKAIDLRLKTLGAYLDKVQVSSDSQINIKIDCGDADGC